MRISVSSTRIFPEALLCLMMLPLLFININNFHDWGDDFAQYLLQAEVITNSIPEMPVSDVVGYSPATKGLLFSALLTPAILFSPEIISAGKIIVSLSLIFCGLMLYKFFNQKFNTVTSFITALLFVYNYHILRLKDQVLPDLLFAGIVLAVFILIKSEKQNKIMAGLILAGITTGFKSIGFALVFVLVFAIFFGMIEVAGNKKIRSVFVLLFPCILILLMETLSAQDKSGTIWYATVTFSNFDAQTILNNFISYKNALGLVFEQELPLWINKIIRYFVFAGFAGGMLIAFRNKSRILGIFVSIYIVTLLLYPYNAEPVRFIIPLIPFVLLFVLDFYKFILETTFRKQLTFVPLIIALALAGSQVITSLNEITKVHSYDPWSPESRAMISFVENGLKTGDKVAFQKPWALAFFTGKHCVPADAAYRADYIVFTTSVADPEEFSPQMPAAMVFKNREYKIMKAK